MTHKSHTTTLQVEGMHCSSCNILVEKTISQIKGVNSVKADYQKAQIDITHTDELNLEDIKNKLRGYNYYLSTNDASKANALFSTNSNIILFFSLVIIVFGIQVINSQFKIWTFGTSSINSVTGAFLLGLIASVSTCMATSGAILYAFLQKIKSRGESSIKFSSLFALGRLGAYLATGFVVGSLGGVFFKTNFYQYFLVLINLFLIAIALHLAEILPKKFNTLFQKGSQLYSNFESKIPSSTFISPFLYGFLTILVACGFTWSVLLHASSLANPIQAMLLTGAFCLGTLPALLALGYLQEKNFNPLANRLFNLSVASIIFVIALSTLVTQVRLYFPDFTKIFQSNTDYSNAISNNNSQTQILEMRVNAYGYTPSKLIVKKGIPVTWKIFGDDVLGCQGTIQAPKAGIALTPLKNGLNTFNFTPRESGKITFACSMGMFSGEIEVI